MMNAKIREFRDNVVKTINESGLPIEVVRLSFVEIMNSLNNESELVISKELQEAKEKAEKLSQEDVEEIKE